MSSGDSEEKAALLAPMDIKQLLGVGLLGLLIGVIVWGLGSVVDQYVLKVLFCQGETCEGATAWATVIGSAAGAGLGLFGLVKLHALRPLLVVLAAMIALWNVSSVFADSSYATVIIATALLYAGMYMLLAWLARLRSMYIVLAVFVVIVIAVRLSLAA